MKNEGLFLAFEGIDGIGKTTQIKYLYNSFLARFPKCVVLTREPGGCKSAEAVREILFNEELEFSDTANLLLFNAARAENIKKIIKPKLKEGKIVISDRFMLSTLAYQSVLHGVCQKKILDIHNIIHNNFMPHITIIFYTSNVKSVFKAMQKRREKKFGNIFDYFSQDTYSKINDVYKKYYDDNKNKNNNLILIDAYNKDIETIHCEVIEKLDEVGCLDLTPCINII